MTKSNKPSDPHSQREAEKYQRPIPSREFILSILADADKPLNFKHLTRELGLDEDVDHIALQRRLNAMERDGQLLRNRRGGFCLPERLDLVTGRVTAHADGFGFLIPDEGGEDVFLTGRQMRIILHGDRAIVRVTGVDRRGRREGAVVEVIERNTESVVGRYHEESGVSFVVSDNPRLQDIHIPVDQRGIAKHGQIVVAAITQQPNKRSQPVGRISEVLGDHMAPGMEIDVAIRSHGLPHEWSDEVMQAAAKFGDTIPEADIADREDLRDMPLVTIDGKDARDFDDAVFCEPHGKGWRLLVAIADVSTYVETGDALDKEAVERGNSVYFPQRVIPMLPENLSNGLCSLNPEVDRLCMVCEMNFNAAGQLGDYRFMRGVMRSHARLTYSQVAAMLVDKDAALRESYKAIVLHLENLYGLYAVLRKARDKRGSIDFDTTETRIEFGEDKKIERISPVIRNDAHKLIEECMINANIAAAHYLLKNEMPTPFRIHDGPQGERLSDLRDFLTELGLTLGGGEDPDSKHYGQLLEKITGRPDFHLIQTVLLRSLQQAVYSTENIGHFGLALEHYAHFTSPIRRYPDLMVHRAIRHLIAGGKADTFKYSKPEVQRISEHSSMTGRRADEATRDAVAWLKCEYMLEKVGDEFEGTISAVTGFGIFVELDEVYVEGLVHVTALENDFYHFDPISHCLVGENTARVYRIGDRVRIQVANVNLDERKIDFTMVEYLSESTPYTKRKVSSVRKGKKREGKKKTTMRRKASAGGKNKDRSKDKKETNKSSGSKKKRGKKKVSGKKKTTSKHDAKSKKKSKAKKKPKAKH
ncbi:MAG: ribonuclease R [Sulfuriflexus sp.]|nr:ribonuclease R [Sulfuriflexus sp.]